MKDTVKEYQSEEVNYQVRNRAGAWINGSSLKEEKKPTQPLANSDHGNFGNKGIEKKNA